jgi:hypothetical protein
MAPTNSIRLNIGVDRIQPSPPSEEQGTLKPRRNVAGWSSMSKRDTGTKRTNNGTTTVDASGATTANAVEQRVVEFAEQLGRIAGTVQAKAEGWMDRETLTEQIASVRDGAADLLKQLAAGATMVSKKPVAAAARRGNKGRSGGRVDAPGKKHREPMPTDPGARMADSQAAKMRTAKAMQKTNRRRGRG